ncbi:hypothetical protein [Rhodalgimonas zhirmunskyi]|uniref:Uncharacterized protein n=1 Tax=Rhodalgimonas zhirmunskyi TaxID=2964767 RepID=A0AAJ1UGY8_9RHOB|nr:hypothetical protein [Rhodoalgimonas zhirmunskyi]MDQ2095717.1 hypothetical protein [Rhodoalgimonas zhirmunskyi]
MKPPLLTEVMAVIAGELGELARIAQALDQKIAVLVPAPMEDEQRKAIQRIDMLHQSLRDLTAVLGRIAADESNGHPARIEDICRDVQQAYIRERLLAVGVATCPPDAVDGQVDLF